jgi:hypothetical protein
MTAMPFPRIQRGEVWLFDLGYLGKVRPVLVLSVAFLDHETVEQAVAQVLGLKLAT